MSSREAQGGIDQLTEQDLKKRTRIGFPVRAFFDPHSVSLHDSVLDQPMRQAVGAAYAADSLSKITLLLQRYLKYLR